GTLEQAANITDPISYAIVVGEPSTRKKIVEKLEGPGVRFPNLIHPGVLLGSDAFSLGKGNIICAGCIISVNIDTLDFVILNLSCTFGHDTVINSYSSFMPSVNISGEVVIEEGVYVGTGAKIINQLEIGEYSIVGAGAVVAKSLPAYCTAVGIPAKPIKFHNPSN